MSDIDSRLHSLGLVLPPTMKPTAGMALPNVAMPFNQQMASMLRVRAAWR